MHMRSLFWDKRAEEGLISQHDIHKREEWVSDLLQLNWLRNEDLKQKCRIRWAVEGDENSWFFHSILKHKFAKGSIKGIHLNGTWVDSPSVIKQAALEHFASRFMETNMHRPLLELQLFRKLLNFVATFLESEFSLEEVRAAVWDCAGSKAPGLDKAKLEDQRLLLFKVDFEKAFDSVNWNFLLDIMRQIGFGLKWRNWIATCLSSATISVLINGSPSNEFSMERGLRQGDTLSPFLFLIVAEALQVTILNACDKGIFKGTCLTNSGNNISLLQFADDTLFFGEWSSLNASNLINILRCFELGSGLKVNLDKSRIFGVEVPVNEVILVASSLGCAHGALPFTYLGLPVGGQMRLSGGWQGIIDRFRDRLSSWKAKSLSVGGRLTLIKSVLGSLPIYFLSLYKAPLKVIKALESIRCRFFWGLKENVRGINLVKWNSILLDPKYGGLGVGCLWAKNLSLLGKWKCGVWLDIVKAIKSIEVVDLNFKNSFDRKVADGTTIFFWHEPWCSDGSVLKDKFRRLYALEMNKDCKVKEKGQVVNKTWIGEWVWCIPPRGRAQDDLVALSSLLNATVFSNNRCDKWYWSYDASGCFKANVLSKVMENFLLGGHSLGLHHRLATRPNLIARGVALLSSNCPLCDSEVEDIEHIWVKCPNVSMVWRKIWSWWNLPPPISFLSFSISDIALGNLNIQGCSKIVKAINGVFQITLWAVWSWRNRLTHAIGDDIIKIKNEDIFLGIQSISKIWIYARIRSNVKTD
ncbi:putative RNA-directed DNA polymerase [Tanacetum coccineum]|uniref:RNA-directed DNA polymerase n=1 Tax=Tanacetum coccineum TaxID=301880 RepID=A0ABQ5DTH2_9ASTR